MPTKHVKRIFIKTLPFIKEGTISALMLPQTRIIWSAFCRHSNQQTFISVMNGVVSIVTGCDKVFRVEQNLAPVSDVFCDNWIHVMNKNPAVNIETFHTEIAAVVTDNDTVTNRLPLLGTIKDLIQISVETECLLSDASVQPQILKTLLKCGELDEFRICFKHYYSF